MHARLFFLATSLFAAACVRPISSSPTVGPLPFATDTLRTERVADGVWRHYLYVPSGPWAIQVLDVDLSRCNRIVALKGGESAAGRVKTTQLMAQLARTTTSGRVVAGVNADFFALASGTPVGLLVVDGHALTPPGNEPALVVDSSGRAHIAVAPAELRARNAVAGHPLLIRDSVIAGDVDTNGDTGFRGRNPRTAVGIARDGRRVLFAVIDGRQKPYSDGSSLRETAAILLALGARDALNLDGGGSSTMVVSVPGPNGSTFSRIANRPSDAVGERPVGDALAVVNACAE
ncbi:MAG TPA: phosphodiester glycosidase family protein [Gemmatimonadaceae bacterium]